MRFIFENGGPTGLRSLDLFKHALVGFYHDKGVAGALLVDLSPTLDGAGEEFRAGHALMSEIRGAMREAEAKSEDGHMPDWGMMWAGLASRYWAEAEAMGIARASSLPNTTAAGKRL